MKILYQFFFILFAISVSPSASKSECLNSINPNDPSDNFDSDYMDEPSNRIINGDKANIADYPYQVALSFNNDIENFMCGGSIIADKFVLTAAHCLENSDVTGYLVQAGVSNTNEDGQRRKVVKIFNHKLYSIAEYENDIGIIKVCSN
ncbi:chymotrypsin-1-like [Agrilus planipennis]|uniref:Chymotrypsin-1-like n=1 Tax=Agrilus planipennis TaxID=224129 RepID=A0A1W4WLF4_AGRPL|nr:chymotrypsin-1-like [Agrilus planipennis]